MKSKPGSGKKQERNCEIVVNHISINEDELRQVSRQSVAALKNVSGHNIKKYSGTIHHKPSNEHVHFLVMSEAPKTDSAVKARIADSMAVIFGTERGLVEVKMFMPGVESRGWTCSRLEGAWRLQVAVREQQ